MTESAFAPKGHPLHSEIDPCFLLFSVTLSLRSEFHYSRGTTHTSGRFRYRSA
jgi:hypothetical protein